MASCQPACESLRRLKNGGGGFLAQGANRWAADQEKRRIDCEDKIQKKRNVQKQFLELMQKHATAGEHAFVTFPHSTTAPSIITAQAGPAAY